LALALPFLCFKIPLEACLRLRDAGVACTAAVGGGAVSSGAVANSAVGAGSARVVVSVVIGVVVMLVLSLLM
jgi:hypothetical protein